MGKAASAVLGFLEDRPWISKVQHSQCIKLDNDTEELQEQAFS